MKELSHDDDIREEGRELGRVEGIEIGRADGIEIGRADGIEIGRADGIRLFIQDKLEDGITEDVILNKLMKLYSLTKDQANDYLNNCRR